MTDEQKRARAQLNLIAVCNPDLLIDHIKENTNYSADLLERVFDLAKERAIALLAVSDEQQDNNEKADPVAWAVVNVSGYAKYVTNDEQIADEWRKTYECVRPLTFTAPAALAQPLEAQADARWQPIETAPKFGEPIDVWGRYGRKTECVFGKPTYAGGLQWIYEASYDSNGPVFEIVVDPTHWMAAPAAPAATNDTEKQS